jgi:hypothetical protein
LRSFATRATLAADERREIGAVRMVSLAAATEAFRAGREQRAARPPRTPLVVKAARAAGRVLPTWRRVRTATLQVTAFGLIDWAAFEWHLIPGLVATGVSLLVLEALGGERR